MSALSRSADVLHSRLRKRRAGGPRPAAEREQLPVLERLEQINLLSTTCPVISGFVFLDENTNATLSNNGEFDPGELPIANATVLLEDANGNVLESTKSAADGSYSFMSLPTPANTPPTTSGTATASFSPTPVLTNVTNQPFVQSLPLFDPTLGTLVGVTVSHTATLQTTVTTQNLSQNSPADITASLSGNYQISGLNQQITGSVANSQGPITSAPYDPNNPNANVLQPINVTQTDAPPATTFTDPATIAFFTASAGRTSITPTMSAAGFGTANAPNGNLNTTTTTSVGSADVSVTYSYIPINCITAGNYKIVQTPTPNNTIDGKFSTPTQVFPAPPVGTPQTIPVTVTNQDLPNNDFGKLIIVPPNPKPPTPLPTKVSIIGVHHQQTKLILGFTGTVDAALANDPTRYFVSPRSGGRIPIVSATFDKKTNSVLLIPSEHLNIHHQYDLSVQLPIKDGPTVLVPFGGTKSLIAFTGHHGQVVHVHNGHIPRPF